YRPVARRPARPALLPYPTLVRSTCGGTGTGRVAGGAPTPASPRCCWRPPSPATTSTCNPAKPEPSKASAPTRWGSPEPAAKPKRSEEHTSELQSRENLVCRLLLE